MDTSLFISATIHERKVKTPSGEIIVWFKELPNTAYMLFQAQITSGDDEVKAGAMARLVSESLCDATGEPALTYEKACLLRVQVLDQMYRHATSLAKGDDAGKDSPSGDLTGSGTP